MTFFDKQGNVIDNPQARYFRLHVENTGLSSVKDCCGFMTKLTRHTDKGQTIPVEEILDLGWAHHPNSNTRDIPRGAAFHMDIATLYLWPSPAPRELRPIYFPSTLKDFFKDKGTYEFEILVAADNARPNRKIPVKFTFDPASDELVFDSVDRSRYPWWALKWRARRAK